MFNLKLILLIVAVIFAFGVPLFLFGWWKGRNRLTVWPFVVGAICFLFFALGLESLLHYFVLQRDHAVSRAILGSPVLYVLYGALAAGIFEETARLFGFSVLLRKDRYRECSIAYGIGHGGIEAIVTLGVTYLTYLLLQLFPANLDAATAEVLSGAYEQITVPVILFAMLERLSAIMAHIGLSVLVFAAARKRGRFFLFPVAILLHAVLDVPAALYQQGLLTILPLEIITFVLGALLLIIGIAVYRRLDRRFL